MCTVCTVWPLALLPVHNTVPVYKEHVYGTCCLTFGLVPGPTTAAWATCPACPPRACRSGTPPTTPCSTTTRSPPSPPHTAGLYLQKKRLSSPFPYQKGEKSLWRRRFALLPIISPFSLDIIQYNEQYMVIYPVADSWLRKSCTSL